MKPWEIERTKRKMKKLSAEKSIRIFFDLYKSALKILRASLLNENPRLTSRQLKLKIKNLAESVGRS